ncbi:hypothetical protein BB561_005389 [Smittium simulii]|uniref:Uncharacterized protein n=1 Tax=Smittium simulii TaxID=133385 RepID=A0A2T9YAM0_9FUNG|nr:hypothetical protein BB561_005389 [Smittium simulii]
MQQKELVCAVTFRGAGNILTIIQWQQLCTAQLKTITQPQIISKVFAGGIAAESKGISRFPLWLSRRRASLFVCYLILSRNQNWNQIWSAIEMNLKCYKRKLALKADRMLIEEGGSDQLLIEEAKPTSKGKKLQNGNIEKNMPYHTQKGLHAFTESRGCIYAHSYTSVVQKISEVQLKRKGIPVLSTDIWSVSQLTYPHQYFAPGIGIG